MSVRIIRDFGIILVCTLAGQWISGMLPFTFPGSIIGMGLLFLALAGGIVRPDWVRQGSGLLIKYMAIMFVPLGVGLVNYLGVLRAGAVPFVLSTVVSTFLTMAVVGLVFEKVKS